MILFFVIVLVLTQYGNQVPIARNIPLCDMDIKEVLSPGTNSSYFDNLGQSIERISLQQAKTKLRKCLENIIKYEALKEQEGTTPKIDTENSENIEISGAFTTMEIDLKTENSDYVETTTEELFNEFSTQENTPENSFGKLDDTTLNEAATTTPNNFIEKSIDDGFNIQQELVKPAVFWTGPAVKTQSLKTKANWTTTLLNGIPQFTDISVYQNHGRSYQFRYPGGLPAELPGGLISWIRENSHKYPQTEIEYNEYGSIIEKHLEPPTELPNRCGTKFLEKLSGGKPTPIEENPWQVAVLYRAVESYICGGALITRRHVLSAAHCFRGKKNRFFPKDIILRVGDYDKEVHEETQIDYSVVKLAIHDEYQEKKHLHDIALLTTNEDIPFSSHIYPICVPPSWADYTSGMSCTVSGWGQMGEENVPTRFLRSGQVSIVSKEDCRKKTIFSRGVPPEVFCAEDPTRSGVDTCLGDSGGPFACSLNGTFYLYGITAFGSYPCGQDIPSFYTNISFYRIWILQAMSSSNNKTSS